MASARRRRNLAAERLAYGRGVTRRLTLCPDCGVPLAALFPFQGARTGTRNHRCKPMRR
jgi:hypothetical protein